MVRLAALLQDELLPAFLWCSESSDFLFYHLMLSPRKDIAAAGNSHGPYTKMVTAVGPCPSLLYLLPACHKCLVCELVHRTRCPLLLIYDVSAIAVEALEALEQVKSRGLRTINNSLAAD